MMVVGAYYPEIAGGSLQCRTLIRAFGDRVHCSVLTTTHDASLPEESDVEGVRVRRVHVEPDKPWTKATAAAMFLRMRPAFVGEHDIFHFHGFTERRFADAVLTTNCCCSAWRANHDLSKEKGWFRCEARGRSRVPRPRAMQPHH